MTTAAYPTVTYVDEVIRKEHFLKVPKLIFDDERFEELSNGAKLLYSYLYNRCIFSAANGFIENEHAYAICRRDQLCVILGCSDKKAGNMLNELKSAGLIEVRRPGQGKPNRIFVKNYAAEDLPYLDGTEGISGNFYQLPWSLITSYGSVTNNAKLLYMLLLDKSFFSQANHWIDNECRNFVYYPLDKITEKLNISRKTAVKAVEELTNAELITVIRQGQGKPNRIYICGHEFSTNRKSNFYTSEAKFSTNRNSNFSTSDAEQRAEVENGQVRKCKNDRSVSGENAVQEVEKGTFPIDNKTLSNRTSDLDHSYQNPNAERSEHDGMTENTAEQQRSLLDYEYIIKENISNSSMKADDVEEIAELTAQTIIKCDTQKTVFIGRTEYNAELLKKRLLSLNNADIKEFQRRVCNVRPGNLRNRKAYIMTVLADVTAERASRGVFGRRSEYSSFSVDKWCEYVELYQKRLLEGTLDDWD